MSHIVILKSKAAQKWAAFIIFKVKEIIRLSLNIIQKPSKNYNSRYGHKPDMIVDHITAGSNVTSAINEFTNNDRASSHFIVDNYTGTIYQCVDIRNAAWGNGTSVEATSNKFYGHSTLEKVRNRKTNANYYTISIEHVNVSGGVLTPVQLAATIELHKYIINEVKRIYGVDIPVDRTGVVGHYEISPITKPSCPGKYFPFDQIIAGISNSTKLIPTYVKSDTNNNFSLDKGQSYQFKISSDAQPVFQIGTPNVFQTELVNHINDDYFYKITAIGAEGSGAGIFVNSKKICVVNINKTTNKTIKLEKPYSDTNGDFEIKKDSVYQFKTNTPNIICGNGNVFKSISQTSDNGFYFTKFQAIGDINQGSGFYLNGAKIPVAIATIV